MASNAYYDGGIDIEEHDVMEHPAFKSAFPDLSIVKTEIYDEEYDDFNIQFHDTSQYQPEIFPPMEEVAADSTTDVMQEPRPSPPQDLVSSTDHVLNNICISNVLGSHQHHQDLPTNECTEADINKNNEERTETSCEDMEVDANVENKTEYEAKCFRSFVRIDNVGIMLNASEKFCQMCAILFKNRSSKLEHDKKYHLDYESDNNSMISLGDVGSQLSHLEEIASETASSHLEEMMRPQRIRNPSARRPYKCDQCSKTFTQRSHVGRHKRNAHQTIIKTRSLREKVDTHLCKLCNTSFNTKFLLIRHLYNHVGEDKKYKCDFCPEVFDQKVYLEAHLWKHVKDRYINAKASDLLDVKPVLPTSSSMKSTKHTNALNNKNKLLVLRCNKCFCIYRAKKVFKRHMLSEHKICLQNNIPKDMIVTLDEIRCPHCRRVYASRKHLNVHILNMCKLRKISVIKQSNSAFTKNTSESKVKIKTEPRLSVVIKKKTIVNKSVIPAKRYYCKKCNVSFEIYKAYYCHMRRQHNTKAPLRGEMDKEATPTNNKNILHKCNNCQAHFHKKDTILKHLQGKCNGKKLVKCEVCNLKFTIKTFTMHRKCHPAVNINAVKYHIIGYDTKKSKTKGTYTETSKKMHTYFNSKNCVFKCKECKCHFTKYMVAAKHAACHLYSPEQVKNINTQQCEKCTLAFTKFGLKTHSQLHEILKVDRFKVLEFDHKLYKTNAWISSILNQTDGLVESKAIKTESFVNLKLSSIKKERNSPVMKDEINSEQTNVNISQVVLNVKQKANVTEHKIYLFKCTYCLFHYNLLKTANCHLYKPCVIRRHKLPPCADCDLLFATPEAHKLYHRGIKTNKLEVVEFNRKSPPSIGKTLPEFKGKEDISNESKMIVTQEPTTLSITPYAKRKTATRTPLQSKYVKPKRKTKLYKCGACGAHFVSRLSYPKHVLRSHTLKKGDVSTKPCTFCNLSFTRAGLRKHRRFHHNGKVNLSTDDFEIVLLGENGEERHTEYESDPLTNMGALNNENETSSNMGTLNNGVITYQCTLCDNRYMTKAALDMHVNIDHMEVDMCCQICDKMFANRDLRKAHLHCDDSTFKCCICKSVLPVSKLQEHSSCHCNVYKCRQCGATFPKLEMLDEHLEISHADFDRDDDEDGTAASMPESGEELSSDMENTVEYTVTQSKAFSLGVNTINSKRVLSNVCTECDYETTDQIKFVLHRHTHKDYGPMDCNKCGMKFIWNKNLMRHLRDKRCRTD